MARTVNEVSGPYGHFMVNPAKDDHPRSCAVCHSFGNEGFSTCFPCGHQMNVLAAVAPITYSVNMEQMHTALRNYKDGATSAIRQRASVELAAVLWRFLDKHEGCVEVAAGVGFPLVTTVPSGNTERDEIRGNLRRIVGELCAVTRDRYERVLIPTDEGTDDRVFDSDRYRSTRALDGADVLLVDDTWTTGHNAQSAAWTLEQAGAATVAMVVIGRHLNPDFKDHGELLKALPKPFDWGDCVYHREG